ncbi:enoyl-CoA hydratase/isomerase family protein [Roseibium sp.]|uniref:enoyl-CoA hydratase/isomerase family protein n=1 Tax=Roseibium sp. TaxID=1936156 RepID=UPI003A98428F
MKEAQVKLTVFDGIAVLTLNRPDSLNALSKEMVQALEARIDEIAVMPDVRVVILTGAGRGFSAGGDLKEFEAELKVDKSMLLKTLAYNQDVIQKLEDLPIPVIGAVNGFAVAGGLELLLTCDLLIASDKAKLGDGHAQFAIVPAGGATVRLMERLPPVRAAELLYTAKLFDAETLHDWGLINAVVPGESLMDHAMEMAREISACSPEVIRHIKQMIRPSANPKSRLGRLGSEIEHFAVHVEGEDLAKGLSAFSAKQKPVY